MTVADDTAVCAGCAMRVLDGSVGCQTMFDELTARSLGQVAYLGVRRLMVDTYCLQHPDGYCASVTSLAAHLTGLCWLIEYRGNRAVGSDRLRRWLNSKPRIEKPAIPAFRGSLTVDHVHAAPDAASCAHAADRWARATWDAYASLHAIAREWIAQALESRRRDRF
jgi:hypothetical protein